MRTLLFSLLAVVAVGIVGCTSDTPETSTQRQAMRDNAKASLQQMEANDSTLKLLVDNAYGYVIFPEVGSGAIGVGGASGDGIVYQNGDRIGTVKLTQASLGAQIGGQTFAELIVFQDDKAFNRMLNDSTEFGADANATAVKAGAAAGGSFSHGVEVFIQPKGGLMVGISLTGQKFHYTPNANGNTNAAPPTTQPQQ